MKSFQPSKKRTKRKLVNTLGEIALKYGITLPTLHSLINLYPELVEQLKPFKEKNKVVLSHSLVELIYKTLGAP